MTYHDESYVPFGTGASGVSGSTSAPGFNFGSFRQAYADARGHDLTVDDAWLSWFVGFCEGECSFTLAARGDRSFVVSQGFRNLSVLLVIRDTLGFGRVVWQNRSVRSVRWVVQDRVGLRLIASLLEGNIVLAKRRDDMARWAEPNWGKPSCAPCLASAPRFTLNDGWLSGFSDGEACFHARVRTTRYRFEYSVSQGGVGARDTLLHLRHILGGGSVRPHSVPGAYTYAVTDLDVCGRISSYLERFPLRTTKALSHARWATLRSSLLRDDHRVPALRSGLVDLALSINAFPDDGCRGDLCERMDSPRRDLTHAGLRPADRILKPTRATGDEPKPQPKSHIPEPRRSTRNLARSSTQNPVRGSERKRRDE